MTEASASPLRALRYVRMPVPDIARAARFASETIGLEAAGSGETRARFRCDSRYYVLELDGSGDTKTPVVGLEVGSVSDLETIGANLAELSITATTIPADICLDRKFRQGLAFQDHSGNAFEIVVRPEDNPRRYFPARDAGITGLSHVAIGSSDVERDVAIWLRVFGGRVSDRAGAAAYIAFDDRHHRLSVHPSSREPAFLDMTFEVESLDAIMQAKYFLGERQIRIVRGPGREPAGDAIFITFEGPGGLFVSYATEMSILTGRWRARQFAKDQSSFCRWGGPTELAEYGGLVEP